MNMTSLQVLKFIFLFSSVGMSAQSIANRGLTHHQDSSTLPRSKAETVMPVPVSVKAPEAVLTPSGSSEFVLSGGWMLADNDCVLGARQSVFSHEYNLEGWYNATVPGTVLTTLVDMNVYPDPYFGLNNLAIPDTLCRKDWWYRLQFDAPDTSAGRQAWLILNGINYAADIWLNGTRVGDIKGAFMRGQFNVTDILRKNDNVLAVHILPPPNPGIPHEQSPSAGNGMNGGQLCLDGPTFISSEGWDWVPGIRDRNIGIWQDVRLRFTGGVKIGDSQVMTRLNLPDTTKAEITVRVDVENILPEANEANVKMSFDGKRMERRVMLAPLEKRTVEFSPADYSELKLDNPELWWPNGYGAQKLYDLDLSVEEKNRVSDSERVRFGIREMSYEMEVCYPDESVKRVEYRPSAVTDGKPVFDNINRKYVEEGMCMPRVVKDPGCDVLMPAPDSLMRHYLVIKVNGQRIFCRGGNWGMDDAMKRVSRERLEPYFRLHKDANFNMIRNWTGESTEEVFYQLCDEYGMLVFNDFWLSTAGYNLEVNDDDLFLKNAGDVVRRFRNHPSIAVWNPRNEGFAPEYIERKLASMIASDDGTRLYSPNSTHCNLRPSGPWNYFKEPARYFTERAHGFNTEQGSTSIPTEESVLAMMDVSDAWPISDTWYYHDLHGGQGEFMDDLREKFGEADNLADFSRKAQMLNYDSFRAMFEAWNSNMWQSTSGMLLWMSHPAWPSMVWQIYSWDYEPFGSFYGCRKACEPVHIQKNLDDNKVVAVNTTLKDIKGARAVYELYDMSGRCLSRREAKADLSADRLTECFYVESTEAADNVRLERLTLRDRKGRILSVNDYWLPGGNGDFKEFNSLEVPEINARMTDYKDGAFAVEVRNTGKVTAVAVKLNLRDGATGERILPAYISDGYFNLLPGERRVVTVEYSPRKDVAVSAEGYNMPRTTLLNVK